MSELVNPATRGLEDATPGQYAIVTGGYAMGLGDTPEEAWEDAYAEAEKIGETLDADSASCMIVDEDD